MFKAPKTFNFLLQATFSSHSTIISAKYDCLENKFAEIYVKKMDLM